MPWRRHRRSSSRLSPADQATAWQVVSLLLDHPDETLVERVPMLTDAVAGLPDDVRMPLSRFLARLSTVDLGELQGDYVDTFDVTRRCCLHLTYYLHGDTRKRGMALLVLKQRYRAHGLRLADGELPDLLPVVLEFAATVGPGDGEAPLRQHRQGVELLRTALHETRTPYAAVLDAVCDVLPELTDEDRAAIAALAFDGPPVETVGLDTVGLGPDLSPYPACSSAEVSR